ncbi:MAG: hypothetical protein KKG09_08645 [Verrucomicrobia bacterium]|nr:hypothetical protein [Verrucomicrobiota bacterium]MBU4247247.1 hypothetical protein [Verrucomicrobiota bacterium]MBU4289947.1 hypothetical protein [Verrucomicrobiota bacterium]MBU4498058.1 hypothetical protein [Verrucomicrobiota bacterium]MCG2679705.1 hypothetical protein [Kiritimatiellia bacterium]
MNLKRSLALVVAMGTISVLPVFAHLCNDVFMQAKDNLAVKVDIRDDQLRINTSAKFRVYLLNTMDRGIDDIRLEVKSSEFTAQVKPSPEWREFPKLKTVSQGGKKEYFEVKLDRKSNTARGKYKIELHLLSGKDKKAKVYKTVDLADAMAQQNVPKVTTPLKIDGNTESAEWEKSLLCSSLYEYKALKNCATDVQTRFRFLHDNKNLYFAVDFQKEGGSDKAKIFVAPNYDSTPVVLEADLQGKNVTIDGGPAPGVQVAVVGAKMEIVIPLSKLKIAGAKSFYFNVTRSQDKIVTYWRGNKISAANPVVFANGVLD